MEISKNSDDKSIESWLFKDSNFLLILLKRKYLFFFLSLIYVLALLLLFKHSYHANDNIGISENIKLGFTPPFFSAFLGTFLSLLYKYISIAFPWYPIFLYSIHAISIAIFIYSLVSLLKRKNICYLIILLYLALYSPMIIRVGYNGAALMIGINSLFAFSVLMVSKPTISWKSILQFSFLFSLSYLIRTSSIKGIIIFSLPLLLYFISNKRKKKVKYLLVFLIPLVLFVFIERIYKENYTTELYRSYSQFNQVRGKFHGYPVAANNINNTLLFQENNWSQNDYIALIRWFYMDEELFSKEKIVNIFNYSKSENNVSIIENLFNKYSLRQFVSNYYFYLILVTLLLILVFKKSIKRFFIILLYTLYCISGMFIMNQLFRFPIRIGVPLFLLVMSIILLLDNTILIEMSRDRNKIWIHNKKTKIMILSIFTFIFFYSLYIAKEEIVLIKNMQYENKIIIRALNDLPSNSLIMYEPGHGFQQGWFSPLKKVPIKQDLIIIPQGWNVFSERFYNELSKYKIEKASDIIPFMIQNHNSFFIIKNDTYLNMIDRYIKEHYTEDFYWNERVNVSNRTIYQIANMNGNIYEENR